MPETNSTTEQKAARSPGPWGAKPIEEQAMLDLGITGPFAYWLVAEPTDEVVCVVEDVIEERAVANAILIAAAPDLKAALHRAVDTIRALHGIGLSAKHEPNMWAPYQSSPEMTEINAALAKADGK